MDVLLVELAKGWGPYGIFLVVIYLLWRESVKAQKLMTTQFIAYLTDHAARDRAADERQMEMIANQDMRSAERHVAIMEELRRLHGGRG